MKTPDNVLEKEVSKILEAFNRILDVMEKSSEEGPSQKVDKRGNQDGRHR